MLRIGFPFSFLIMPWSHNIIYCGCTMVIGNNESAANHIPTTWCTHQSDIDSNHAIRYVLRLRSRCCEFDEASPEGGSCLISVPTHRLHNGVEMPLFVARDGSTDYRSRCRSRPPSNLLVLLPERNYRQTELALSAGVQRLTRPWSIDPSAHGLAKGRLVANGRLSPEKMSGSLQNLSPSRPFFEISHMAHMADMTPEEVSLETKRHFEVSLHWASAISISCSCIGPHSRVWPMPTWIASDDWLEGTGGNVYDRGWARAIGVSNFSPAFRAVERRWRQYCSHGESDWRKCNLQNPNIVKYCLIIYPSQAFSPLDEAFRNARTGPPNWSTAKTLTSLVSPLCS
jgi:hypothetical protein